MSFAAESKPLITAEEIAERWHCTVWTVRRNWRRWGLKGSKFGKEYVFTRASVEDVERRRFGVIEAAE
ncbi:hypothetical protein GOC53_14900 [Sinorhizobium medicae]|nr:hypothetical protein [Sinorhizobium medicae]